MIQLVPLFFAALAHCETRGSVNPDTAIGADGRSVGRYQLTAIYVADVNRILKLKGHPEQQYQLADRTDLVKSEEMIRVYLGYYAPIRERTLGRPMLPWELAMIHHMGPSVRLGASSDEDHYSRTFERRYARGL